MPSPQWGSTPSHSRRTAGSSCRALTTARSGYGIRLRAPSGVCYEAIRIGSMPSRSRRTAGSSCRALTTARSGYGMRLRAPSGVCCEAIRAWSTPSHSRRTAGSSCRALTTARFGYGMRPRAPSRVCCKAKKRLGFSPFPLVVNILLPIVEPHGCLTPIADVRITSLPQRLGLPTMAKSYSTSIQTTQLGLFRVASSFTRAEFHMPCSWIYQDGETCYSV